VSIDFKQLILRQTAEPGHRFARLWRRFHAHPLALLALAILIVVITLSLCAPLISRYLTKTSPERVQVLHTFEPISTHHWLGTDEYGRDVLTRVVYGGRASLGIAFLAVGIALSIGTLAGTLAAYYAGWVDMLIMRFVDVMLSIPSFFLLLLISSLVAIGPIALAVVIALLNWFGLARLVRAEVLTIKQREYIVAARVVGMPNRAIIIRHIMPNVVHLLIVWATLAASGFILTEAALSFLGLGVQLPTPSWGNMLNNAAHYFYTSVALACIPGCLITLTVLSLNLIGDALRDVLDPRIHQ